MGLVGFAGNVIPYQNEHVFIETMNHGNACVGLVKLHCGAMVLRQTSQVHQRGSRNGVGSGVWFAEPPVISWPEKRKGEAEPWLT